MRSSFYSTTNKFGDIEPSQNTQVVDSFKLSNILDFNEQEKKILADIKSIIGEECDRMQQDIDELQTSMMQASATAVVKVPNPKELKEFSSKLQVTFIPLIYSGRTSQKRFNTQSN